MTRLCVFIIYQLYSSDANGEVISLCITCHVYFLRIKLGSFHFARLIDD